MRGVKSFACAACFCIAYDEVRDYFRHRTRTGEAVPLPKAVRPKIEYWNREEAMRFLAVADADPYRALRHVAMNTGMRKSELRG
jgi:integrase